MAKRDEQQHDEATDEEQARQAADEARPNGEGYDEEYQTAFIDGRDVPYHLGRPVLGYEIRHSGVVEIERGNHRHLELWDELDGQTNVLVLAVMAFEGDGFRPRREKESRDISGYLEEKRVKVIDIVGLFTGEEDDYPDAEPEA